MKPALRVALVCGLLASLLVPPGARSAAQTSDPVTIEDPLIIESKDGTPIVATLMLPPGASRRAPVPVVLQTHGVGRGRSHRPVS